MTTPHGEIGAGAGETLATQLRAKASWLESTRRKPDAATAALLREAAALLTAHARQQEGLRELVKSWEDFAAFDYDNGNIHGASATDTCAQQLAAVLAEKEREP